MQITPLQQKIPDVHGNSVFTHAYQQRNSEGYIMQAGIAHSAKCALSRLFEQGGCVVCRAKQAKHAYDKQDIH